MQLDFSKVPGLIARWWFLLAAGLIVGGSAGYLAVRTMQPVYQASVTVQVSRSPDAQSDDPARVQALIRTYAEVARTLPILRQAATQAGIAVAPSELQSGVTTTPIRETQLLKISVEDSDRERVVLFATALANVLAAQLDQDQASRFATSKSGVNQAIESLRGTIGVRESRVAQLRAEAESPTRDTALALADSELLEARNNYAGALKAQADLLLLEARSGERLSVVEPARLPDAPIRPSRSRVILIGMFGGLTVALAVIGGVVLLEGLRSRSGRQGKLAGLPVLANVASSDGAAASLVTGHVAEGYASLPSNLAAQGVAIRSVMVTSAKPSAEKSSVAASIAVTLARSGRRVVLVDGDLHQPAQAALFRLPDGAGLSTLLFSTGKTAPSVLRDTAVNGLRVMTAGPLPPDPATFLREHSTRERMAELYAISDVVVVDGPPLTSGADAFLIGLDTDATVLVVDGQRASSDEVAATAATLEACGVRAVGAVIHGAGMADHTSESTRPSQTTGKKPDASGQLTLSPSRGDKWS